MPLTSRVTLDKLLHVSRIQSPRVLEGAGGCGCKDEMSRVCM